MAGFATPNWRDNLTPAIIATRLAEMGDATELAQHAYGVCTTAAATAAKTVTLDLSNAPSTLFAGLSIRVKFTYGNTAANPTLNIGTGAYPIMSYGATAATTWRDGQILSFTFDGTNWLFSNTDSVIAETAVKIATGTYTGTGTYGASNPVTLTFAFQPLLVIVYQERGLFPYSYYDEGDDTIYVYYQDSNIFISGQTSAAPASAGAGTLTVSMAATSASWHYNGTAGTERPRYQLNTQGETYNYIAIGI